MQPSGSQSSGSGPSGIRRSGPDGSGQDGSGGGSSTLKKALPILLLGVAAVVVAIIVVTRNSDDTTATPPATTVVPAGVGAVSFADVAFPEGVTVYDKALKGGTADSFEWGARCDTSRGRLALPQFPQQPCFAPIAGDNGGATAPGVTKDTIKVIVYLSQQNDPVLTAVYRQIANDDTVDQVFETYQKFNDMYSKYYELYGRKVVLERYDATGTILDPTAATFDAETIAAKKPFMVMGGPLLTSAFADTLAAKKVMCVSCTPGQPSAFYGDRAPYVWDIQKNPEQNQQLAAEYIGKRLQGGLAEYAGDAALKTKQRSFGYIHVEGSDASQKLEDKFVADLAKYDTTFTGKIETYKLPTELATTGRDIITRLKDSGVTSVVFSGDPLAPQTLTKIATEQQYFPEWIVTGTVLVDTTAFSRTYDQQQWAHAFGVSNLFSRVDPSSAGAAYLYNWYYGTKAPADQTLAVLVPNLQFLYNALPGTGPALTPEAFQKTLFITPVIPSTPITPQISFGNRGFFADADFNALDDQVEIWWDATATGTDELDRSGTGMYQYANKGKRYLPGQWPTEQPKLFDPSTSVTIWDTPPAEAALPTDYVPVK